MSADALLPEDDRLYDLLAEWGERRASGPEPTPEELCPEDTILRERLRARIAAQKRLERRLGLDEADAAVVADAAPECPPQIQGVVIDKEVGRGAMGVVYLGRQLALDRLVAVKVILGGAHAAAGERSRFRTEAVATARIPHPNIVAIHDSGESHGLPYLVLEYLEGGSLADRLKGEPQDPRRAGELVLTLAGAVAAAHARRVVHRDLKPRNVLFAADGTPKIADYGLAKLVDVELGNTVTGQSPGTPSYMAPEQAGAGQGPVGPLVDVYALGAILYELLTGRPPLRGATVLDTLILVRDSEPVPPRRLQPKVPRDLETICLKCLEKRPDRRYPTPQALGEDLQRFLDGRPIVARPVGVGDQAWRWCRRHPSIAVLATALALVTVGGIAGLVRLWSVASADRRRAEANLDRVVGTLDSWYTTFANRAELASTDLAPLRRDLLVAARDEFERLASDLKGNPRLKNQRVRAMIRASQAHSDLGEDEAALLAIRAAVAAAEESLRDDPRSLDHLDALVLATHWSFTLENDNARVFRSYERAASAYEVLIRGRPEKADGYRHLQMLDAYHVGIRHHEDGRPQDALEFLGRARDRGEPLSRGTDVNPTLLQGLAGVHSRTGEVEAGLGLHDRAKVSHIKCLELTRRLLERHPRSLPALKAYGLSCVRLGDYLEGRGDHDGAIRHAREACRAFEEAASSGTWRDYEILEIRRSLVEGYFGLQLQHAAAYGASEKADPRRAASELGEMERVCRKAVALGEALRPLKPDPDLDYWMGSCAFNLHQILWDRGDRTEEVKRLVSRARELTTDSLRRKSNEGRQAELGTIQGQYDRVFGREK